MNPREFFKRLRDAVEEGQQAFWRVVAGRFPEATSGDFDPAATLALEKSLLLAALRWTRANLTLQETDSGAIVYSVLTTSLRELSQEEWEKEAFQAWLANNHMRLAELMALGADTHGG